MGCGYIEGGKDRRRVMRERKDYHSHEKNHYYPLFSNINKTNFFFFIKKIYI